MDIPDLETAWKEMVASGSLFHEGFESEWEWKGLNTVSP
jgi:hypothetical protein